MPYYTQYQQFTQEKNNFFKNFNGLTLQAQEREVVRARNRDYFLFESQHLMLLENEFKQLLSCLEEDFEDTAIFWLYCYWCGLMLQSYYQAYGKVDRANQYKELNAQIFNCWKNDPEVSAKKGLHFGAYVKSQLFAGFHELISTPQHVSQIRSWVGFVNIKRLQLTFSRIATTQIINYANSQHWMQKLQDVFNLPLDAEQMTQRINSANHIFNYLSVGLFAARLMLHSGMILKHTFLPQRAEKRLTMQQRLVIEFRKRRGDLINDGVWLTINSLTNFNKVSAPIARALTSSFLLFDASFLVYRKYLAKCDYLLKKEQYLFELEALFHPDLHGDDEYLFQQRRQLTLEQLKKHEIQWQATSATFNFNIGGAMLLMGGFTASLLLTAPAAAPLSFIVSTIGAAMYLSADLYDAYVTKSLEAQEQVENQSKIGREISSEVYQQASAARNAVIASVVENTVMPILFFGTLSVSTPAAVLFVSTYMIVQFGQGFNKQKPRPKTTPVSSPRDSDEDPAVSINP